MGSRHKNLEFHVENKARNANVEVFNDFDKACIAAIVKSLSAGGAPVTLDVVTWDAAAAKAWGGEEAVYSYLEDPEASVHQRFLIRVDDQGRIA